MKLQKYLEFKKADLEPIKSFHLKDKLSEKVWDGFNIKADVRESLLKIAEDFYSSTDLDADVIDIALCGSLCNYNWSEKYSDYDLHIIINYNDINEDIKIVEKLCDLSKKIWNQQHEITIKGYDVEVAIQNKGDLQTAIDKGRMGGVYSLLKDKWIKKPEMVEFEPDESLIEEKGKTIMMEIDDLIEKSKSLKYTEIKERIKKSWEKIKTLRERSLEEEGEFGIGNLVFKLLRRNNYLGKIMDLKRNSYDKQYEEFDESAVLRFLYKLDDLSTYLDKISYEGWSTYLHYTLDEENDIINIEFGASGYSDGFSEDMKIYWYEDTERVRVERSSSRYSPYGDSKDNSELKYEAFDDIFNEIKSNFMNISDEIVN